MMTEQLGLLETMSPKEYQQIRLQLGNGSGQESPGFRTLLRMPPHLWDTFVRCYLEPRGLTVEKIYDSEYAHDDAYVVAEALIEYDELFQTFRYHHMQLIYRSIGMEAKSLKGRSVELLRQYYPKGTDLSAVRQAQLDIVARKLNTRPRKTLVWKTPAYIFQTSVSTTH